MIDRILNTITLRRFVIIGSILCIYAGILFWAWTITNNPSPRVYGTSPTSSSAFQMRSPVDLNGEWKSSVSGGVQFIAEITDDRIKIEILHGDTRATFWCGTFKKPEVKAVGISSEAIDCGDKSGGLFLSSETSKPFTLRDEKIIFEFSIQGVSKMISLAHA
jgi:hypothetical protein